MSAADKTKLDTAISEEQLTAVENKVDTLQTEVNNIKSGTTDLGYLKAANPTYTGTLNGVNATFTGDVIVPTPDGDTEAANKSYVDSAIDTTETALREDISEVQQSVMQQTGTIDILSQTITGITQGTTKLPYVKNTGDTVNGDYTFNGKVNINQPTDNANATNKEYVDTKDTALDQKISKIVDGTTTLGYIKNTGGTATGAYDFTGATMKVAPPSEDANAANKGYVDGEVVLAKEKREVMETGDVTSYTIDSMKPNTLYIFSAKTITNLTVTAFAAPSSTEYVYTYHMVFHAGTNFVSLNLPDGVIYPDGFEIEANRIYEINIMENLLSYQSWPVE